MYEHAGDQAPPLATESERAEVRAESDALLRSGIKRRDAAKNHDGEYEGVDGDKRDGYGERRRDRRACRLHKRGLLRFPLLHIAAGAIESEGCIAETLFEFFPAIRASPDRHETKMVTGLKLGRSAKPSVLL